MSTAMNRRQALLGIFGVGGTVAGAMAAPAAALEHPAHPVAAPDTVAMLYDNTICTGCRACMPACNEANGLPADTSLSPGILDAPSDLNSKTKNIIKLYEGDSGAPGFAFVKRQCMHCLDPACVAGCPFGALEKNQWGAVTWNPSRCVGCRYFGRNVGDRAQAVQHYRDAANANGTGADAQAAHDARAALSRLGG